MAIAPNRSTGSTSPRKTEHYVPEGKEAWLSNDQYLELKRLFDQVSPFASEMDGEAFSLYDFFDECNVAKLNAPMTIDSIHFNAFVLIRRGYKER